MDADSSELDALAFSDNLSELPCFRFTNLIFYQFHHLSNSNVTTLPSLCHHPHSLCTASSTPHCRWETVTQRNELTYPGSCNDAWVEKKAWEWRVGSGWAKWRGWSIRMGVTGRARAASWQSVALGRNLGTDVRLLPWLFPPGVLWDLGKLALLTFSKYFPQTSSV